MHGGRVRRNRALAVALMVVAIVFVAPTVALAFNGEVHEAAIGPGLDYFRPSLRQVGEIPPIQYGQMPIFPELEAFSEYYDAEGDTSDEETWASKSNRDWAFGGATAEDHYDTEYGLEVIEGSLAHFWDADHGVFHTVGDINVSNAWTKAEEMWIHAVEHWNAGETGFAYLYLGKCLHLLTDQGQPAHPHGDIHFPDHDSLEDWAGRQVSNADSLYRGPCEMFDWYDPARWPGSVLWVPKSNQEIYNDILANPEIWMTDGTTWSHSDDNGDVYDHLLEDPSVYMFAGPYYNVHQLFYMFWTVNQIGDGSASDDFDGDQQDDLGWVDWSLHQSGVTSQTQLDDNDTSDCSDNDAHDAATTLCMDNTDDGREECNWDYDFSKIMDVTYRAAFRTVPAMINLFRLTVDSHAPDTTLDTARSDGQPLVEWNNVPVIVRLTEAVDEANNGMRASGVWKVWGVLEDEDGNQSTPLYSPPPENMPYLLANEDGSFKAIAMSTDMCGNIERANNVTVQVDMTPPVIEFPNLRPNYLTSEDFVPTFEAYDETSGLDGEPTVWLDGNLVPRDVPIDLSLMAGSHRLEVYAFDKAGNWQYRYYDFEVWIDTLTDAKPINLQTKTSGQGMFVMVQFPAPYDVGQIGVASCKLVVKGEIDLEAEFPVSGGIATIDGELLTGVGDVNEDGIPDRMIRFDKYRFAEAVAGETGDIQAVVYGALLPHATPRFIGNVTIPVFSSPKKK